MPREITYDPRVRGDLEHIGAANARRVRIAIESKLRDGDPNAFGFPLRDALAGYRKLRVGDVRIVYKVINQTIRVHVITVDPRRNDKVYKTAGKRIRD